MNVYGKLGRTFLPTGEPPTRKKATKKPKVSRVAKPRAGGEFSEARFWSFLRSGLRQMSRRWPPLVRLIWLEHRRPYVGPNKRQKFEYQCWACHGWFIRRSMEADHIEACGSLTTWDDLPIFARRLFCEVDNLRILCEECHKGRRDGDQGGPLGFAAARIWHDLPR